MLYLVFVAFILPSLFFMIVWGTVMICRICFPERPVPFEKYFSLARWEMSDRQLPVGVREIRREQEQQRGRFPVEEPMQYIADEPSSQLPEQWVDELWHRRN